MSTLSEIEKRLENMYKKSRKDIASSWIAYMNRAAVRLQKLQDEYDAAKQSGDADEIRRTGIRLANAKRMATIYNDKYKDMVKQTTEKLADLNSIALAYVNGQIPEIYFRSYNAIRPDAIKMGIDFTIINQDVIRKRVMEDNIKTPYMHLQKFLDIPKDERWNTKQLNSAVLQGILQGESMGKIAQRIYPIVNRNGAAAIRNARTMVTGAENSGRLDSYKQLEDDGVVLNKVWMSTPDGRTRDEHVDMDGEEVGIHDKFSNGCEYPGDPAGDPATVYNCFVGETKIASDSEIVRSYCHEYNGELIEIETSSGVKFTCTPNHPILSSSGWIKANLLNEGDNILVASIGDNGIKMRNPDINHVFPRMDAFHKFFDMFGSKGRSTLSVNFHGDIPTSDVEIITKKRFLRDNRNVCRNKFINKFRLILSDSPFTSGSTLCKHFRRIRKPSLRFIRMDSKLLPIFKRSVSHSDKHSLRTISTDDICFIKSPVYDLSANSEFFSNSFCGFPCKVFPDNIIRINVSSKKCHVYNLQTENGYYFVNSIIQQNGEKVNGNFAIVHNCRCTMVTHIIGFKKADGSISKVKYDKDRTIHDEQMEAEKERRRE